MALGKLKPGSLADDVVSGLGKLGKDMGRDIIQTPTAVSKTAIQQIANPLEAVDATEKKKPEKPKSQFASDSDRSVWLQQLYGPSQKEEKKQAPKPQNVLEEAQVVATHDANAGKTPEEVAKMQQLKQQLHQQQYFNPTFNRPKKQSETEEREKEEREKRETAEQRMQRLSQEDLQKKKKEEEKKKPIAVQREQNKAEMFRGAAG